MQSETLEQASLEAATQQNFKCKFCPVCDGLGCIGEMPGMGGAFESENFIANCAAWKQLASVESTNAALPKLRLAPITGAVENIGYSTEKDFYLPFLSSCLEAGAFLSIGDGTPDEKLKYGIDALQKLKTTAAVFIKPYPDKVFFERLSWAKDVAEIFGIDIDSYSIVTMRKLVNLEKKTPEKLKRIKKKVKVPFAIKGVFTKSDVEMLSIVKPDIAVVSNHGGRIETERGSTAHFLLEYGPTIKKYCGELWVDGGLRTQSDLKVASLLGASTAMLARPFITAFLHGGSSAVKHLVKELS